MSGFIKGEDRHQATMFPERLDDYIAEDSAVRVIDVFLDDLDLTGLGFKTEPNVMQRAVLSGHIGNSLFRGHGLQFQSEWVIPHWLHPVLV